MFIFSPCCRLSESCFFLSNFLHVLQEVQKSHLAQAMLNAPWNLEHIQLGQDLFQNVIGKPVNWEEGHTSFILAAKCSIKECVEGVNSTYVSSEYCLLLSSEWLWRHLVTSGCFVKLRYTVFKRKSKSQAAETVCHPVKVNNFVVVVVKQTC